MTADPIIQVENLTAKYGDRLILKDVSFAVEKGEIFVILGPSGCGKSTLMRHMLGLDPPHQGRVVIDGDDISDQRGGRFQETLRKVGVLFQGSALLGSLTVGENIALPLKEYTDLPRQLLNRTILAKLCMVGLGGYENHLPAELSGGMKKRAALARAMAMNPLILFLDEPGAGLDPVTAAGIDELVLRINRREETTMVIVTHELASIFKVAHRVIMLDGKTKTIIAQGDPRELRDHSDQREVRRFFNREADHNDREKNHGLGAGKH